MSNETTFRARYELDDGYAGGSRPHHFVIQAGDIEDDMTPDDLERLYYEQCEDHMRDHIGCSPARVDEFVEWATSVLTAPPGATQMSHTEQMREALRKVRPYIEDGANHGDDAVELLKLVDEALTAPAAEVPEAMGDEPELPEAADQLAQADGFNVIGTVGVFTADQLRTYAQQYAQWQSTRLRGGVPSVPEAYAKAMDALLDFAQTVGGSSSFWDDVWPEHEAAMIATAAPQAPALDAGVVRDAERWRKFVSLEYKVRREWAANLSLTPVLAEWVDSLPSLPTASTKDKQQ